MEVDYCKRPQLGSDEKLSKGPMRFATRPMAQQLQTSRRVYYNSPSISLLLHFEKGVQVDIYMPL